jgi:glutaminyl-peptide cyclotransferase
MRLAIAFALAALAGAGAVACGQGSPASGSQATAASSGGSFDARRAFADLREQVSFGARAPGTPGGRKEVKFIASELRKAGVEHVRVQHPHKNVVGTIPGDEPGSIVVGAHHDTKTGIPGFVGANDGASGVAVILELARDLPQTLPGPSIRLALFDAEESRRGRSFADDGERGSRQYVKYAKQGGQQGSPPISQIKAMVLFDMVGDCDLAIPHEFNSDRGLYDAFASAAESVDGSAAPFEGESGGVLDDDVPFLEAGVPAVDLIDFRYGPGGTPGAYWHTAKDNLKHVCASSLDAVGEAALVALPKLG